MYYTTVHLTYAGYSLFTNLTACLTMKVQCVPTFLRQSRAKIVVEIKRILNGNPAAIPQLFKLGQRR